MIVTVDTTSGVPPYEQVREQVARMIGGGVLAPGERLPTIQQLANDLGLAPGTIARAYKELEHEGLVVSRRRRGTVVADRPVRASKRETRAEIDRAAEQFAVRVRQLGADPETALARVRAVLAEGA
jgi:DNA-binding transcriptional regulator YhcF (GntR family)